MQPLSIDKQMPAASSQPLPSSGFLTHEFRFETKFLLLVGLPGDEFSIGHLFR
jgi:hypothetical protein